jgi:hypothetical protein
MNEERLIPPTMLYRLALPCRHTEALWDANGGLELEPPYRLPCFGVLDGRPSFADVRVAWSSEGLFLDVQVRGKQQSVWCRETQLMESDGLQVWIDTRNTHNVHRATRYCHWFLFLPSGGGSRRESPVGTMLKINRSKEDPRSLNQMRPGIVARLGRDGYRLLIHIPRQGLDGWDPREHPRLGFNYALIDRELGNQTLAIGSEFPIGEDPGLWQTLELVT